MEINNYQLRNIIINEVNQVSKILFSNAYNKRSRLNRIIKIVYK